MNYDLLFAIILYAIILVFYFFNKDKFKVQGKIILLYPTKIGLNLMDRVSKISPKILKILGYVAITLGFIGMGFILYTLVQGAYQTVFVPKAPPTLAPVLPGIKIPGLPTLSFWHWIIAILITATVHEFSHGVFARLFKIKIKSSGFALFGPILAAFVEPEEENLKKIRYRKQLAIFSAGPFANIILGIIFILILNFITGPPQLGMIETQGITVNEVREGYPAQLAGLQTPFTITEINGQETLDVRNFTKATLFTPGEEVNIKTDKGTYELTAVTDPENATRGVIGISGPFEQQIGIREEVKASYGEFLPKALVWINVLILWLFVINIGIGLFNLLPLGPVDGGRMFYVAALGIFKNENKARRIWGWVSFTCLMLIFINLWPWISQLITFITGLF
ncbi:MAG: site-2 protease family protein [archaeon]